MFDVVLVALLSVGFVVGSPASNTRGKAIAQWMRKTVQHCAKLTA